MTPKRHPIDALMALTDRELVRLWNEQEPTPSGTDPAQDVLAAEIERRKIDL